MKKNLWLVFMFLALVPLRALYISWILSTVWDWFLEPQYGSGPSYPAWFGISVIWQMLSWSLIKERADIEEEPVVIFLNILLDALAMLFVLSLSAVVRFVLGWS